MFFFFFFKQKTAYEMRISDWSSDVCSSDLLCVDFPGLCVEALWCWRREVRDGTGPFARDRARHRIHAWCVAADGSCRTCAIDDQVAEGNEISGGTDARCGVCRRNVDRSEEHTSELQSLMRISYAVFCLKKKQNDILLEH